MSRESVWGYELRNMWDTEVSGLIMEVENDVIVDVMIESWSNKVVFTG